MSGRWWLRVHYGMLHSLPTLPRGSCMRPEPKGNKIIQKLLKHTSCNSGGRSCLAWSHIRHLSSGTSQVQYLVHGLAGPGASKDWARQVRKNHCNRDEREREREREESERERARAQCRTSRSLQGAKKGKEHPSQVVATLVALFRARHSCRKA